MSTEIGNSGLLALKAITYKNHIDGTTDNHDGYSIELNPSVTVDGYVSDNVQIAIEKLNTYIDNVVVDATTSSKGVIQLSQDLGGTASLPKVIRITGDTNQLDISPRSFVFDNQYLSNTVEFKFLNRTVDPKGISIQGQGVTLGAFNILRGGPIILSSGLRNTSNSASRDGNISINVGNSNVITAKHITLSSRVISLFKEPTSAEIPGEANNTLYVYNTSANPTQIPVDGSHLYSLSGKLRVYHTNGDNFNIGDNPANWQSRNQNNGLLHKVNTATTTSTTPTTMATFTMPTTDSGLMLEVDVVGKAASGTSTVSYKLIGHFYSNGSLTPVEVGTESTVYSSINGSGWIAPTITVSGTDVLVKSGAKSATVVSWSVYCKGLYRSI